MTASCLDTLFSVDLQFSEQVVDKTAHFTSMISLTRSDSKIASISRNDSVHFCEGNAVHCMPY